MKGIACFLIIILICVGISVVYAQSNATTYIYQIETNGQIEDSVAWRVIKNHDSVVLESSFFGTTYTYECNPDYSVQRYFVREDDANYLDVTSEGDYIKLTGRKDGDSVCSVVEKGEYPWYQNIGWAASHMLSSGQKEITFSLLRPDNFSMVHMQAGIIEEEKVLFENEMHDAVKVKITLTGFLRHFWSGYYWYRKSDYKMVKYHGASGGPGSPKLTMLLINEYVN